MRTLAWFMLTACGPTVVDTFDDPKPQDTAPYVYPDTAIPADTSDTSGADDTGSTGRDVCARWNADRADLSEGNWSGSASSCDPGDMSTPGPENALKLVNLYRFLAGLDAVAEDPALRADAQACALLMHANSSLSHAPPSSWNCYHAGGAALAGRSNLATTAGVTAVDLYMADPGNATTLGHRRWILSNGLGPVGLGSTSSYSCMQVIGGSGPSNQRWTAWPPPGDVPIGVMSAGWSSVDPNGWSVQSDAINLNNASVSVTDGGQDRPVSVEMLLGGYGSTTAIRILPQGWNSTAGHSYEVVISGLSEPISYTVRFLDC